MGTQFNFF
jgi:hypothetical protein